MMKIRILSQLISLILLVLVIALAAGCSTLYKAEQAADQIEEQVEQKVDQAEAAVENKVTPSVVQNAAALTQTEAEEIALLQAGFKADQVTGLHTEFDVDDGIPEYEVEFFQDGWEYDYTIHADTGEVLSYDISND